jgi:hypothetical protein
MRAECCGRTDGTCWRCPTKPWPPAGTTPITAKLRRQRDLDAEQERLNNREPDPFDMHQSWSHEHPTVVQPPRFK